MGMIYNSEGGLLHRLGYAIAIRHAHSPKDTRPQGQIL